WSIEAGFVVAGVLSSIAAVYVLLRMDPRLPTDAHGVSVESQPSGGQSSVERASSGQILWRIKNSCFATFAYGYFQASVVLFLPLFLMESKGISKEQTIVIPAFFAGGMLLFINFAARVGDRFGHLFTMRVLATVGGTTVLGFVYLASYELMCFAVALAGATLASISPVSLALQGVVVEREDYSRATAIYNVFYAAGMLLGPFVSSIFFDRLG